MSAGYENGILAEWSKALVSGTSLRAWVRIPRMSVLSFLFLLQKKSAPFLKLCKTTLAEHVYSQSIVSQTNF